MSDQEVTYTIKGRIVAADGAYLQTMDHANNTIAYLRKRVDAHIDRAARFKAEMHRWEAKFRQVTHENNQLRKALHQ